MITPSKDVAVEAEETARLRARLKEFDEAFHAIQAGTVDALVLDGKVCSLKEAETRYCKLIEEMNDGAATLAEDGTVLYCNRCFANMVGASLEDVIGTPLSEFVADPDRPILSKVLDQGRQVDMKTEIQLKRPEAPLVPILLSVKPLELQNEKVLIAVATDLTGIKAGIKRTQYLASIPESSPNLILEFNLKDELIYSNPMAQAVLKQLGLKEATVFLPPNMSEVKELLKAAPSNPIKSEVAIQDRQFDLLLCFVPEVDTLRLFAQDITERKRAEEALRESEDRLNFVLKNSRIGVWELNLVTHTAYRTLTHDQIFGYPVLLPAWTYEQFLEHVLPEDRAGVDRCFRAAQAAQSDWTFECRIRRADGEVRWIWATSGLNLNSGDKLGVISGIVQDITERKLTELAASRLAAIVEFSDDAIIGKDLSGVVTSWNHGAEKVFGYTAGEMVGASIRRLIPEDHQPEEDRILDRLKRGESVEHFETERLTKAGRRIHVSITASPIKDAAGRTIGASKVARDITERKKAEAALRESEQRYRTVADFTYDWEYWQLPDGRLTYISPSCERVTGYSAQEFQQDPGLMVRIVHPEDRTRFETHIQSKPKGDTASELGDGEIEFRILTRSGEERWIGHVCREVYDTEGNHLGRRCSNREITERKRAEAEIRRLYTEMEQRVVDRTAELTLINKELESFSYSISHDLRAPLRSIDGFSRILLEDYAEKLDAAGRENLDRVRAASQRMGHLIDDMLKLSRYTRSPICCKPVDLSALARSVAEELMLTEPDRRVEMVIEPGLVAKGDAGLIQVVLENLLGNAWKFTSKTTEAKIEFGRTISAGELAFFVRDNGAGFDMTYSDKLFGTFQRLHSNGEFPGTGIGLATVQRVIHRHHGRVWAEAQVGQGATFYFTLPEKAVLNIPSQNSHEPTV